VAGREIEVVEQRVNGGLPTRGACSMVCFLSEGKANNGLIQISLVFPNLFYKYLLTAQAQNSAQGELLSQEKCT
jgi:hypothetical protein